MFTLVYHASFSLSSTIMNTSASTLVAIAVVFTFVVHV